MKVSIILYSVTIIFTFAFCSSPSKEKGTVDVEELEQLNIEGSWSLFNLQLKTIILGETETNDMKSGNQIYHFTEDSMFIISDKRCLVLQCLYKIEGDILYYSTENPEQEFNVVKKIHFKEEILNIAITSGKAGSITHQFKPTELDMN